MLLPGRRSHLSPLLQRGRVGRLIWVLGVLLAHALALAWLQRRWTEPPLPPRLSVNLTRAAVLAAPPARRAPALKRLRAAATAAQSPQPALPPLQLPDSEPIAALPSLENLLGPDATDPLADWPLSTRLRYRVEGHFRGPVHGDAEVEWLRQGDRYQLRLSLGIGPRLAPFAVRHLLSEGRIHAQGLRPERYDERTRIGLGAPRHTLLRLDDGWLRWSNGRELPAPPGVQDSASQFGQMAWELSRAGAPLRPGQVLALPLALPQQLASWRYEVVGVEWAPTPLAPATELWHLRPLPPLPAGALAAEVWLAPALSYLPLRLRIAQGADTWLLLHLDAVPLQEAAQNAASVPSDPPALP